MATATVPASTQPKDLQTREKTNLELALTVGFARDLTRFLGSEEATASLVAEIYNQARRVPGIYGCTVVSIQLNVARIASLRLNPALPNMVHFIPRNNKQKDERGKEVWVKELTTQYGYAGLRELVMRSPEVIDCFTQAVCVNDDYEPPVDAISPPRHRLPRFQPRGRVEGYYATIKLANGHWRTLQMSVAEVLAHAKQYVKDPGPAWQFKKDKAGAIQYERPDVDEGLTSFDKQGLKTVLRMLCNGRDVPMTADVSEALRIEEAAMRTPIAAEYQGYDRQGNRPALTESTGLPMDELSQDLYGTRDKGAVERYLAQATQGQTLEVDPRTGVILGDEERDTRQQTMGFSQAESDALDAKLAQEEAGGQPSNAGVEGSN